jgi:hypothetical protein
MPQVRQSSHKILLIGESGETIDDGEEDEMYARIEQHALRLPPSRTDQTWTPPQK